MYGAVGFADFNRLYNPHLHPRKQGACECLAPESAFCVSMVQNVEIHVEKDAPRVDMQGSF